MLKKGLPAHVFLDSLQLKKEVEGSLGGSLQGGGALPDPEGIGALTAAETPSVKASDCKKDFKSQRGLTCSSQAYLGYAYGYGVSDICAELECLSFGSLTLVALALLKLSRMR